MPTALAAVSTTHILAGLSFALVAWALVRRSRQGGEAGVVRSFAGFWSAMSTYMLVRGTMGLAASSGWTPLWAFAAVRFVEIGLVSVAAWGLSYYVGFLYTGWRALRFFFGAYFVVLGTAFAAASASVPPTAVIRGDWAVELVPATPFLDVIYAGFGIPMLVGTSLYLSLAGRQVRPIQRYRVVLVSSSLLGWIGTGLVASIAGDSFRSFLAITVMGIVTTLAVFLVYYPPMAFRRRWAPEELTIEDRREARKRSDDLRARVAALI